jgi:Domain of unknown function (DUF4760)
VNVGEALAAASVIVSMFALAFSTLLLARQNKQLEHERNAMAILDAIARLTDPAIVQAFGQLEGIGERYSSDDDVRARFFGSNDDRALVLVAQYVETVACLSRRGVLDASLLVDAVGYMLRSRWNTVRPFVERLRRVRSNDFLFENFEWLAMYSAWWRDVPRPPRDPNYDEKQFAGVEFRV